MFDSVDSEVPKAIVLGAAAGGGFPQWNCGCPVCSLAWNGDPRVIPRTQSSVAVTGDGATWILLNASPDLGQQIRATPALRPHPSSPRGRHSPLVAVVLTNADVDHIAGLLSLRERQPLRIVALGPVHAALDANPVFEVLARDVVEREIARPGRAFEIATGVSLEIFAVPGKAPLYAEGEDPEIGHESGETAGVMVEAGSTRLAYLPACADLTPSLVKRLARADVVLFDGTLFTDDEMVRAGLGLKTGRRMGHVPISGAGGSLEMVRNLPARRKVYIHINNTNPILIAGSPQRRMLDEAGIEVAHDGMEIEL